MGHLGSVVLAAAGAIAAGPVLAGGMYGTSVTIENDRVVERCDDLKVRFGDMDDPLPSAQAEQTLRLPGRSTLRARLDSAQGIIVRGSARADYEITVCKSAGG